MSELKITGRITKILPTEKGTSKAGKDWEKGGFVIDTGAQYNPEVCFSLFGKNLPKIEGFKAGDEVEVYFNVSSREYNEKYYHNIDAWKIDKVGGKVEKLKEEMDLTPADEDDDLPF